MERNGQMEKGMPFARIDRIFFKRIVLHLEGECVGCSHPEQFQVRFVNKGSDQKLVPQYVTITGTHFEIGMNVLSVNGEMPMNSGKYALFFMSPGRRKLGMQKQETAQWWNVSVLHCISLSMTRRAGR